MPATAADTRDGVLVVQFLDPELSDELRIREIGEELIGLIGSSDSKQLLLDFDGVSFMSSSMLGQLAMLSKRCMHDEISLKMCNVAETMREVLRIVRLDTLAQILPDEEEAFAAFEAERAPSVEEGGAAAAELGEAERHREAAERGDAEAQYRLGTCYENGTGIDQDFAQALAWYRRSADQGHVGAQHALATAYAYGMHVPQDYDEAVRWYLKAAEQGYAESQYAVGMNYSYGIGVEQDSLEAEKWYRKAAQQGHVRAREELDKLKGA
jgi:anti-anti-sigma factor